ncbi:MAG: penicillin-binding protein 2 [Candidatus Bipolaricaulota bacterium]|nr:penicillin-binding protein 2 [Candidatus Bipolaricaulota bacterium]
MRFLIIFLAALVLLLIGRLIQLQVVEHESWAAAADAVQERILELPPQRGTIYDCQGEPLAFDVKAVSIAIDSFNMTKPETIISILQKRLSLPMEGLKELIYRPSYFTWIKREVELETAQKIEQEAAAADAFGLIFIDTWSRCYPQGNLASNVIGFVGVDRHGLEGIELAFDDDLAGQPAQIRVLRGADGRTYFTETLREEVPGEDLYLTIDSRLQFICEEEIERGVARFRANTGFIILLDPNSGQVLAMAQGRRYDLNDYSLSSTAARKNLAINMLFEPGSSFKAMSGLAAIEYGVVNPDDLFNGNDGIRVAGHVIHNSGYESFGTVSFAEIIEHSINTGMIRVAERLGQERLHRFLVELGFGQKTGISLPGEENGILRPVEDWSKLALASTSIGQSVGVTGIQLIRGMAAVANGGRLLVPYIVRQGDAENTTLLRRIASEKSSETMCRLLQRVVESGTGTRAAIPGFNVAGKTGTAQKAVPGQGYIKGKYTSLFAGFFPVQAPTYLGLVVLDEVKTTPVWGGYTAGQIFSEVGTRIVNIEHLAPVLTWISGEDK